jgi:hypothetical protein
MDKGIAGEGRKLEALPNSIFVFTYFWFTVKIEPTSFHTVKID